MARGDLLRLLLDHVYSPELARRLRARGHDVIHFVEDPERDDFLGYDRGLFLRANAMSRVIVTTNVRDVFRFLWKAFDAGNPQPGVILTSDRGLPRTAAGLDALEEALHAALLDHPGDWELFNSVVRIGPYPLPPDPSDDGKVRVRVR